MRSPIVFASWKKHPMKKFVISNWTFHFFVKIAKILKSTLACLTCNIAYPTGKISKIKYLLKKNMCFALILFNYQVNKIDTGAWVFSGLVCSTSTKVPVTDRGLNDWAAAFGLGGCIILKKTNYQKKTIIKNWKIAIKRGIMFIHSYSINFGMIK